MNYTPLPHTDLKPSALCLGTAGLGSALDRRASFALLDAYLEQGGNFIDTARVYANWLPIEKSISEKTIGLWLRARKNRDRVIVATKGGHPDLAAMRISRLSRPEILFDLRESLKNLRTDRIDIYWLHRDDVNQPVEDIMETLAGQVKAGAIRYCGCSNWRVDRIRAAQACAQQQGWLGFAANQMMWNLGVIDRRKLIDKTMVVMDDDLKQFHLASGLPAIPYSSQANGLFQRLARGTVDRMKPSLKGMYNLRANQRRFVRMQKLSVESGLSVTDIVLAYLQSQPFPVVPIVGCQNITQLQDSLHASHVCLSLEQVKYLETDLCFLRKKSLPAGK
jgi:aryl-alcohol dehydrogenase-like predicted oxidoreductase